MIRLLEQILAKKPENFFWIAFVFRSMEKTVYIFNHIRLVKKKIIRNVPMRGMGFEPKNSCETRP